MLSVIVCHIPDFLLHTKETEVFISVDPSGGICRDIWMSKQSYSEGRGVVGVLCAALTGPPSFIIPWMS